MQRNITVFDCTTIQELLYFVSWVYTNDAYDTHTTHTRHHSDGDDWRSLVSHLFPLPRAVLRSLPSTSITLHCRHLRGLG